MLAMVTRELELPGAGAGTGRARADALAAGPRRAADDGDEGGELVNDDHGPSQTWGPAELAGLVRTTAPAGLRDVLRGPRRDVVLHAAASGMAGVFRATKAPGLRAVIHWRVGDRDDGGADTFELAIADGVCVLSPAPARPSDVTLSLGAVDFLLMVTGRASPLALFMREGCGPPETSA